MLIYVIKFNANAETLLLLVVVFFLIFYFNFFCTPSSKDLGG